ncbi:uncharacterized protein EI90DRAFT_3118262 [Cantharellus anzutake]|uniref:uncharacterized protein n=1 Tax=Cantharellus anzutake TaxID=1750568 RepID=UPI001908883B|nr:uncharacterized protein EI90DRAFT_3118262 [Cantharellus anzutake]KAF8339183.1 hypothetical protein EI90DRAFT_3118262 [Cantharellus anzutake]
MAKNWTFSAIKKRSSLPPKPGLEIHITKEVTVEADDGAEVLTTSKNTELWAEAMLRPERLPSETAEQAVPQRKNPTGDNGRDLFQPLSPHRDFPTTRRRAFGMPISKQRLISITECSSTSESGKTLPRNHFLYGTESSGYLASYGGVGAQSMLRLWRSVYATSPWSQTRVDIFGVSSYMIFGDIGECTSRPEYLSIFAEYGSITEASSSQSSPVLYSCVPRAHSAHLFSGKLKALKTLVVTLILAGDPHSAILVIMTRGALDLMVRCTSVQWSQLRRVFCLMAQLENLELESPSAIGITPEALEKCVIHPGLGSSRSAAFFAFFQLVNYNIYT